jgi:hypothetical protein
MSLLQFEIGLLLFAAFVAGALAAWSLSGDRKQS